MHIISFMFRSNPQPMCFHYDMEETARKQYLKTKDWSPADKAVEVADDYGSKAVIRIDDIAGVFLTDLSKEMNAQKKRMVAQKKTEMAAHKEAMGSLANMMPANKGPIS